VREINQELDRRGRGWAYTTVQTLLRRLCEKGYVKIDKSAYVHVYRPALSRDEHLRQGLSYLVDQFCEGTATPLVMALVRGHSFSSEEIDRFRRLLDELEQKQPKKRKRESGKGKH
jgi:predicted transcriptional regulator